MMTRIISKKRPREDETTSMDIAPVIMPGALNDHFWLVKQVLPDSLVQNFKAHVEDWFPLERSVCQVFGKSFKVPRDQILMPAEVKSVYARHVIPTRLWAPEVTALRDYLLAVLAPEGITRLDYALINGYYDRDSVSPHADTESNLDPNQAIVSVSFGKGRPFNLYETTPDGKGRKVYSCCLEEGDVLIMRPGAQALYKHAIPPLRPSQRTTTGRRYNVTFRCLK